MNMSSFHIIQKIHKETEITWTYPTITNEHKSTILKKTFAFEERSMFNCLRHTEWLYICELELGLKRVAICLITQDYDPSKYEKLANILLKHYHKTENPVDLVKMYLNVFTQSSLSVQENGTLIKYDFKKCNSSTHVKELIKAFGVDIILIYAALLLKKRILVYIQNVRKLQMALLSISTLMQHRDPNDYLYPSFDDVTMSRRKSFFLAGTNTKPNLNTEYYDLYVNFNSRQISILPHATDIFTMNKILKDLAIVMVKLAEDAEMSENEVVARVSEKTNEVLKNLKSLATFETDEKKQVITLETLQAKQFNPATEHFLFNLAVAENIMML